MLLDPAPPFPPTGNCSRNFSIHFVFLLPRYITPPNRLLNFRKPNGRIAPVTDRLSEEKQLNRVSRSLFDSGSPESFPRACFWKVSWQDHEQVLETQILPCSAYWEWPHPVLSSVVCKGRSEMLNNFGFQTGHGCWKIILSGLSHFFKS